MDLSSSNLSTLVKGGRLRRDRMSCESSCHPEKRGNLALLCKYQGTTVYESAETCNTTIRLDGRHYREKRGGPLVIIINLGITSTNAEDAIMGG